LADAKKNGHSRTVRTASTRRGDADPDWQNRFISALELTFSVRYACRMAVVSRDTVYRHRNSNADFRARWDKAREIGLDRSRMTLQENSLYRAIHGTKRPIMYKGKRVGWETIYDTAREKMHLEALIPSVYSVKPQFAAPNIGVEELGAGIRAFLALGRAAVRAPIETDEPANAVAG